MKKLLMVMLTVLFLSGCANIFKDIIHYENWTKHDPQSDSSGQ